MFPSPASEVDHDVSEATALSEASGSLWDAPSDYGDGPVEHLRVFGSKVVMRIDPKPLGEILKGKMTTAHESKPTATTVTTAATVGSSTPYATALLSPGRMVSDFARMPLASPRGTGIPPKAGDTIGKAKKLKVQLTRK